MPRLVASRETGKVAVLLAILVGAASAFAQQPATSGATDLNRYYRFPVSLGIEYQTLSPFAAYGSAFNVFGLAVNGRIPLPSMPMLQPVFQAGMFWFDSRDPLRPDTWDHTHYFGELGIGISHRFAKTFEIGIDVLAGMSEAVFRSALPEEGPYGSPTILAEAGARMCLDPSYNFCIEIRPGLKYFRSLSSLHDFDGLAFSLGFSAQYRFGEDPDAPRALVRSIRFDSVRIAPLFAAMQSYYATHPVGTATITNTEKEPITDVAVLFNQKGFMDSPTPAATIPSLAPGETREVALLASFNRQVFDTEGVTPLTGEVQVSYRLRGRPVEQSQPVAYDLHDKTAIVWNDDRKVAAFVTPADSALRNYASFVRQSCKGAVLSQYSEPLQIAMQVYSALAELGCIYQPDPSTPFEALHAASGGVDSVSLARDTLNRATGDCDDLTVAFCSLLEAVGVETGFITIPGHIYPAINAKVASRSWQGLHPDRSMGMSLDGELWLPVEITMVGKGSFLAAWRKGAEEFAAYDAEAARRTLYRTKECQAVFRPVALTETDLGLQYGSPERISARFQADLGELTRANVASSRDAATRSGTKEDYNRLGIECARAHQYEPAAAAFEHAVALDASYLPARVNLGNLLLLQGQPARAIDRLREALAELEEQGQASTASAAKILVSISRAYYQQSDYVQAKDCVDKAVTIDPSLGSRFGYLAQVAESTARGSEVAPDRGEILFIQEWP